LNGLHQNSEDGGWWWVGKYGTANIKLWAYFEYPFKEENGFNLDDIQDGLQLALPYKRCRIKENIERLGSLYLSKGKYLCTVITTLEAG
jgi:hypothetical protein